MKTSFRFRFHALAAILAAPGLLTPASFGTAEPVLLPFHSVRSLILVDAKVNGRSATLLLDTGANNTIINAALCGNAQAPRIEPTGKGPGIVGNTLRLRVDLEIARHFLFSQPVSVMNLGDLPKSLGADFDGLLGQDILRQFRSIRINYRDRVIELEK
ncbi:MAG TPA: retropepsin-like aspartic protease [Candidatus Acidoferrum sp.]|nr:retropepsin-like aspartic protease [Candidatus Acidoferrum sp.]